MSAGTGMVHSEFNASDREPSHSIQIWIEPRSEDLSPRYQQIAFRPEEKRGRLRLLAGPDGEGDPAVTMINQNARMFVAELRPGDLVTASLETGRHAWLQILRGDIRLGDLRLGPGDGAAISELPAVTLQGEGEVLLFDLP